MPEWQGAGVGTKFLDWVCEYHKRGQGRCAKKLPTLFHTSHPQLIGYLQHSKKWVLKSQNLYGGNKVKSMNSIRKANPNGSKGANGGKVGAHVAQTGYGGHFRAVQGYKYIGDK